MHTHTLLLVDDSITVQRVIRLTFAGEPIRVVVVEDGHLAVDQIEASRPDIVLASTDVPGLDGYAIARHVSQTHELRQIPVLLLTDRFGSSDERRVKESGASGIVQKPLEPSVVVARVRRALGISTATVDPNTPTHASTPTSDPPHPDHGTDQVEKHDPLTTAFDSIDAVMDAKDRQPVAIAPEELAQIVSDAVAQAIAAYERARGLSPGPPSDSTLGSPAPAVARDPAPRLRKDPPAMPPAPLRAELERLQRDMGIHEIAFEETSLPPVQHGAAISLSAEMGLDDFVFDDPSPAEQPPLSFDSAVAAAEVTPSSVATEPTTDDAPTPQDDGLDWLTAELGSNYAKRARPAVAGTTAPDSSQEFAFDADDLPPRAATIEPVSTEATPPVAPAVFWAGSVIKKEDDRRAEEPVAGAAAVTIAIRAREGMRQGAAFVRTASVGLVGWCRSTLNDRAQRRAHGRAAAMRVAEPLAPVTPAPPRPEPDREPEPVASSTATLKSQVDANAIFFTFDPIPPVPPRLPREPRKD